MNDVSLWLQQWVEENLDSPRHAEAKSELANDAARCAQDAVAQGYTIAQIKEAAGGDLETYLLDAQNAIIDAGRSGGGRSLY